MKKRILVFLASLLALGACSSVDNRVSSPNRKASYDEVEENNYHPNPGHTGELGSFSLISPTNGKVLDALEPFSWEASENADRYTIEICSDSRFINDIETIDYYRQDNITVNHWTVTCQLAEKDTFYYWRVTAYNKSGSKECNDTFSFYMLAPEVEEVSFDIGEADDWSLHPLGSYADISIDNNNYFGNDKESLKISFKIEDTNQGISSSDGWIVVARTIEKSIYGTDALYFNLYYAGQDADIFVRLLDKDNEYWVCPVLVSNNAKQQVILKFSDFVQRTTADVTIGNRIFDFERIKYLEVVFEHAFGDGILFMSDIKAIKFDNYRSFFIQNLDFSSYTEAQWANDNYDFDIEKSENELTLKYYSSTTGKPKINGYGFAKLYVNQYFYSGDSIKVSVKYTGSKGSDAVIRIVEEDTDRWSYMLPFSALSDEYQTYVIPFAAFGKSDITGDGKRQFYNISCLQFGLQGQNGEGTLSFKDFEIVYKKDHTQETKRVVGVDGLVEDFNNYQTSNEMYLIWNLSEENKDEYIRLNSTNKVGGADNPFSGQFEYKSDMFPAQYELPVETTETFESFSIWMKDASIKTGDAKFGHVTDWRAEVEIYITLLTDEIYKYPLGSVERIWTEYNIPFSKFEITNGGEFVSPEPIIGNNIASVAFTMQYFYYNALGDPLPQYTNSNPVLVDNIIFAHETELSIIEKERVVRMNGDTALIDNFEQYPSTSYLESNWHNGFDLDYQKAELSNKVSSEGGNHSMALQFKSRGSSPSYYISPAIDQNVLGRALRVSLCSDKSVTVYLNLYLTIGSSNFQYRATINSVGAKWTEYTIGLNNFAIVSGFNRPLSAVDLIFITKISFGMIGDDATENLYNLYVDNMMFIYDVLYSVNTTRVINE